MCRIVPPIAFDSCSVNAAKSNHRQREKDPKDDASWNYRNRRAHRSSLCPSMYQNCAGCSRRRCCFCRCDWSIAFDSCSVYAAKSNHRQREKDPKDDASWNYRNRRAHRSSLCPSMFQNCNCRSLFDPGLIPSRCWMVVFELDDSGLKPNRFCCQTCVVESGLIPIRRCVRWCNCCHDQTWSEWKREKTEGKETQ